jgi:hypothetical protein
MASWRIINRQPQGRGRNDIHHTLSTAESLMSQSLNETTDKPPNEGFATGTVLLHDLILTAHTNRSRR